MIHDSIKLWQEGEYDGADDNFTPTLSTYVLKNAKNKGAVLIFPGGGYEMLSWREAEPIALWANSCGYHAFVLYYSIKPNRHPQPLRDATRAMCLIRDNAEKWGVNPEKIAVCGFSAGGHLAASLGVYYDAPYLQDVRGMSPGKNKPTALILSYPVITGDEKAHRGSFTNLLGEDAPKSLVDEMSLEKHVTDKTPTTFIWATFDDVLVPCESTLLFASALKANDVPFELHIYPEGAHGLALCNEQTWDNLPRHINPHAGSWLSLCREWLAMIL